VNIVKAFDTDLTF